MRSTPRREVEGMEGGGVRSSAHLCCAGPQHLRDEGSQGKEVDIKGKLSYMGTIQ